MNMRCSLTLLALVTGIASFAQNTNARLRVELEVIHELDQHDRQNVHDYTSVAKKDSAVMHLAMLDPVNLLRVLAINDRAGLLGADELGAKASQALFLVLQHADEKPEIQAGFLEIMRQAAEEGKHEPMNWQCSKTVWL